MHLLFLNTFIVFEFHLNDRQGEDKFAYNNMNTKMKTQKNQWRYRPTTSEHSRPTYNSERSTSYLDQFMKKFVLKNSKCSSVQVIQQNANILFQEDKWKMTDFQELKDELNTVKSQLNDLNLEKWHKHTNNTNIGRHVIGHLKYLIGPEFLTQAWCKFTEISATYNLIPKEALKVGHFNSVHLSEAPGAFITSLNHFLQSNYSNLQWHWVATSLNPYYEGNLLEEIITDDRFMMHTLPNWAFGDSLTGDLMSLDNMLSIVSQAKFTLQNKIMLVTADGSVDCQLNPAEQEESVAALKYCETITALHLLEPGGHFVLKIFTLFECETLCLMNLLCTAFETVEFFKPIKSKGGNSEVYVICLGYVGQKTMEPWLGALRENYGRSVTKKALFPKTYLQPEFIHLAYQSASYFMNHQIMVILFNVKTFKTFSKSDEAMIEKTCLTVAEEFVTFYGLRRIGRHQMLVGNDILKSTHTSCVGSRLHEGTFNELHRKMKLEPTQNLKCLSKKIEELPGLWEYPEEIVKIQVKQNCLPKLQIQLAKPMGTVRQSRFCQRQILKLYQEVSALVSMKPLCNSLPEMFPGYRKCYVSHHPWESNVEEAQRQSVMELFSAIADLKEEDSLCIVGLSLLTQFTVGLVFLLAHSFHHVGFVKPNGSSAVLVFVNFVKTSDLSWMSELEESLLRHNDENKSVHSFVPIKLLAFEDYEFYNAVCTMNRSLLKMKMYEAIKEEIS